MLNKAYYSKILLVAMSFGAMASITSGAALAGFEWVPKTHQPPVKAINEQMHTQGAPVPNVSNEHLSAPHSPESKIVPEHASEIIHVPPQPAQNKLEAVPDIMTPSPFDTIAAPAQANAPATLTTEPQPVINTIDFTNTASTKEIEDSNNNEILEHIEVQNLSIEEEAVSLSTTEPTFSDDSAPENFQTGSSARRIIPIADQPQQLAPSKPKQEETAQPLVITTYPENPTEPALGKNQAPMEKASYEDAVGFGKDMPMALAVQQILPPGYVYSFAKSVNPGTRVSWNGGKQWNLVLLETLEPLGLSARIEGKNVVIVPSSAELSATDIDTPEQESRLAANEIFSIEPASGTEQPQIKPNMDETVITNRLTIRDPGQQETEQPGLSKSALLKPVSKQGSSLILPSVEDENTDIETQLSKQNTSSGSRHSWTASKGDSLKKVIYDWAKQADIQIVWEASHDYILSSDFTSSGPFNIALENLINNTLQSDGAPSYRMLDNIGKKNQMALIIVQDTPDTEITESDLTAG